MVIVTRKQLLISLDVTKNSGDQSERRSAAKDVKESIAPYDTHTQNIHNFKPNYTFNKCAAQDYITAQDYFFFYP